MEWPARVLVAGAAGAAYVESNRPGLVGCSRFRLREFVNLQNFVLIRQLEKGNMC